MKLAGRVYRWMLVSLVLQLALLAFINNVYLNREKAVKVTNYDSAGAQEIKEEVVKIPNGAEQVKVSFNGAYAAYVLDGRLEVMDLLGKKNVKTMSFDKGSLSCYRWLPDRNMIIYALKSPENNQGRVRVITYSLNTGVEHSYPAIGNLPKESEAVAIELSPLTNVVYVKVKVSDSQAKVYKYNIMDNLSYVMNVGTGTVIKETSYSDMLVYQDGKNKLFVWDGKKNTSWPFPFKRKMVLLGIDGEDRVYAGELDEENRVGKVWYGKLAVEPDKAWNQVVLKNPAPPRSIFVARDGTLYQAAESENRICNVAENYFINYTGKLTDVIDGFIITIDKNELRFTKIRAGGDGLKN